MLKICLRLGVKCVSAYTFSIENFKRSQEEVNTLMGLAEEKLLELCDYGCALIGFQVKVAHSTTIAIYWMNMASD